MNRSRQIINILEGFKLGSLGVSHKPKVTIDSLPQEPEEKKPETRVLKVLKQGERDYKDEKFPFIVWQDPDGWDYYIELQPRPNEGYVIHFYCGHDFSEGDIKGYEWEVTHESRSRFDAEPYTSVFLEFRDKIFPAIHAKGIKGVLKEDLLRPTSWDTKYDAWRKAKRLRKM
jgi:hypothetical protein